MLMTAIGSNGLSTRSGSGTRPSTMSRAVCASTPYFQTIWRHAAKLGDWFVTPIAARRLESPKLRAVRNALVRCWASLTARALRMSCGSGLPHPVLRTLSRVNFPRAASARRSSRLPMRRLTTLGLYAPSRRASARTTLSRYFAGIARTVQPTDADRCARPMNATNGCDASSVCAKAFGFGSFPPASSLRERSSKTSRSRNHLDSGGNVLASPAVSFA